jgi:RNA polymerase sigma-70 factor (ECF subfamily)
MRAGLSGADSGAGDRELLDRARARAGTPEGARAAGELLRRYQRAVYLWCFRYVRDHERALDMSQEVLLSAYQRMGEFEGRAAFSSWLFVIARNRCLNEMRNDSRRDGADPDSFESAEASIEDRIEEQIEQKRLVDAAARVLDAVEQRALWLRYSERMPVDEITRLLKLDHKSGARAVLQRARRKLREALEEA